VRRRQAPPALKRHTGLKDPRRPASLLHACIVVSLMAGVCPEEARAIGWEQDVNLDGTPPSVAVLRADRAGGDTKTPRSCRTLKLAQMAAGAESDSLAGAEPQRAGHEVVVHFHVAGQGQTRARPTTSGLPGAEPGNRCLRPTRECPRSAPSADGRG
jgi:hypothetical protein